MVAPYLGSNADLNAVDSAVTARNVLGTALVPCSYDPLTGYLRDGCCTTDASDKGSHLVCVRVTQTFLDFSLARGNDLVTPRPQYRFAGIRSGDRWCLAPPAGAKRWRPVWRRLWYWSQRI